MDSRRLLLMPRSFLYAVDEARTSSGSRPVCISTTEASDSRPKSFLDVTDVSACRVMFSFLNTAAQTCSITQVYLDDGEVMAIDVALQPANHTQATLPDELDRQRGIRPPGDPATTREPAIIFDLRTASGMADIVCALSEERLKISLEAVKQDRRTARSLSTSPCCY
jgi:hypothetical protein